MGTPSFLFAAAVVVLCSFVNATIDPGQAAKLEKKVEDTVLLEKPQNVATFEGVAAEVAARGGCDPNICFALDGSSSIPPEEYEIQKNFIQLITAIVGADPRAGFAAVQYGRELEVIRRLSTNPVQFITRLTQSSFKRAPATFIEPGVLWCAKELEKVEGEPAKLIVLGDGRSPVFDRRFAAEAAADFRAANPANVMCAVGVGFDDPILLREITGSADTVFEVTDWIKILNILDELVADICGITPTPRPTPPTPAPPTTIPTNPGDCPCQCMAADQPGGDREERRIRRKVRDICRPLKSKGCSVKLCPGQVPVAFQCC